MYYIHIYRYIIYIYTHHIYKYACAHGTLNNIWSVAFSQKLISFVKRILVSAGRIWNPIDVGSKASLVLYSLDNYN